MDAERARIAELAEAARRLPVAERRAFLDGFRLDDSTRRAVESALAVDQTVAWRPDADGARLTEAPGGPRPDVSLPAIQPDPIAEAPAPRSGDEAARAMDPLVGRAFGGVRVERVIGSGGMGRVYLGSDASTGAPVALKVLLRTQRDDAVRKRFEREGRLLEKLRHPGIAAVLRTGIEQDADVDVPYIVMEYVEGVQGISDRVFRDRLGTRETVECFLQACDAVAHAHREGYVHRDLKPQNILVDRHGRVKVIDFGVARAISVDPAAATVRTETGQIVGTMQYMSPEQFVADPRGIDARTDVYALCAVLYELLTGVQPHELRALPVHEAARRVCETDAPDVRECNPRIDERLAAIVMDGLAREKSRRPDDAHALGLRLRGWMAGGAVEAAEPAKPRQAPTRGGARPAVTVHAGHGPARRGGGVLGWLAVTVLVVAVSAAIAVAFGVVDVKALLARFRGAGAAQVPAGTSAPAPAPAATVDEIRVVSVPRGAQVTVDGQPRGASPAIVLLPSGGTHSIVVSKQGWGDWRGTWRTGDPAVVAANLVHSAAADSVLRLFALDVGELPRGTSLRVLSKLALDPVRTGGELPAGTTCVEVPFQRRSGRWEPADQLVLSARHADGTPAEIEFGALRGRGEVRPVLAPEDAGNRIRVRVH